MRLKKEGVARSEATPCQKGNTKDSFDFNRKGKNLLLALLIGEDSKFPSLFEILVLPKENLKGGKNEG